MLAMCGVFISKLGSGFLRKMVVRDEYVALGTLDVRHVSNMEEWMRIFLYPRLCDMIKVQLGFDIPQIIEYARQSGGGSACHLRVHILATCQ